MTENDLSPNAITENLGTRFMGQRALYYSSLTSTMEVAKQEARRGAAEGTMVIADEQTSGLGRMRRTWLSPKGSISLSIILYPREEYLSSLIMLASLAVVRSIETVTGLRPQIKWPNDVLINGKKVCGILIESDVQKDKVGYVAIGIGINVNFRLVDFPQIPPTATSLLDELGKTASRLDLIRRFLVEIEALYLSLPSIEAVYEQWRDRLVTLGQRVSVRSGKIRHEGLAESVGTDGSLLLRHDDGTLVRIIAGDVVTLRD